MNLKDIVCDPEHAKRLKELGVRRSSLFRYNHLGGVEAYDEYDTESYCVSDTYTVAELGEMLPKGGRVISYKAADGLWDCDYIKDDWSVEFHSSGKTEVNCRASMLVLLIEKGKINVEELNK
jgi:hypothetical protein